MSGLRMRVQLVAELSLKLNCYGSWIWHKWKHFFFTWNLLLPICFWTQTLYFKWSALLTFFPSQCLAFVPAFPLQRSYNRLQVAILTGGEWPLLCFVSKSMYVCYFPQNESYYPYCSQYMVFHFYPTQDEKSEFCSCSVVDLLSLISSIWHNLGGYD